MMGIWEWWVIHHGTAVRRDLHIFFKYLMGEAKVMEPDLVQQEKRQQAQTKNFYLKIRKNIFTLKVVSHLQALTWLAQRGYSVFILGTVQNPTGRDPKTSVVGDLL